MNAIRLSAFISVILFSSVASAQDSGAVAAVSGRRPDPGGDKDAVLALRAERVQAPPTIDGDLSDPVWAAAQVATGFTQMQPNPGNPATQSTDVRVLYDDQALYVAARMHDTAPDSVVAQLGRRDNENYSDWMYVGVDSYFDRRTGFAFGLNPRGVMVDVLLFDDTEDDESWDAVWEGAARRDPDGWTAEFRIPLSQLRFRPSPDGRDQVWGINFVRKIARNNEQDFWAPTLPSDARVVSLFGELRGLRNLHPPRRLEVMPYAVASATRAPREDGDPFYHSVAPFGGAGADVKAGITSDLTLTATINPDFGQVEADPSVVNLSAFETFFPEKRPFFMEGMDIFRFGLGIGDGDLGNESLFYSRRIGRSPQGDVDGDFVDAPEATTILGAAKLSGKTASGWSIGVLDALTGKERARSVSDGEESTTAIEPLTNYGVARVIRDFRDGKSAIGGILTSTNRSLPRSGELDWLRKSAYTAGVDVRHRFGPDDAYQVSGSLVGSYVTGTADAIDEVQTAPVHYFQRPDADYLEYDPTRTSLSGTAGKVELWKLQGDWRFALFGMSISPGFDANDLGFQSNGDMTFSGFWTGYRENDRGPVFRSWNIGSNFWNGYTYGGDRVSLGGNVNGGFELNNLWGFYGGINYNGSALSTSMLRGGPGFLRPTGWSAWSSAYTDHRKPVQFGVDFGGNVAEDSGGRGYWFSPGITIRPSDNADFHLGPSFSKDRDPLQYVDEQDADGTPYWILGTVDQTTVSMTARLNYTFSPALSLQLYAQPFISAGTYSTFKYVTNPRAAEYTDRFHVIGGDEMASSLNEDGELVHAIDTNGDGDADFEFTDPGFNFKQLRSNVVLRWEYRPGSTLFVVWSHGRTDSSDDGRFRFGNEVSSLWNAPGTNVLLLKVSYWFGV